MPFDAHAALSRPTVRTNHNAEARQLAKLYRAIVSPHAGTLQREAGDEAAADGARVEVAQVVFPPIVRPGPMPIPQTVPRPMPAPPAPIRPTPQPPAPAPVQPRPQPPTGSGQPGPSGPVPVPLPAEPRPDLGYRPKPEDEVGYDPKRRREQRVYWREPISGQEVEFDHVAATGLVCGREGRGGRGIQVRAQNGPKPPGQRGYAFETDIEPTGDTDSISPYPWGRGISKWDPPQQAFLVDGGAMACIRPKRIFDIKRD